MAADPEDQIKVSEHVFQNPQSDQNPPTQDAEQASEQAEKLPDDNEAYSFFTTAQKKAIVLTASFCAFFSPTTGSIYYPALNVISHDLHVSNTAVNLTVTTCLLLQGLAPTFVAGFSDGAGRPPAFFICFILYIAANVGLGAQNRYAALLILRCLQSAGSSSTVALSNGIAADVVRSAERGLYVAIASMGALIGPMYGRPGFLATLAGAVFVPLMLFLPETNRRIVADGSYQPPLQCQSLTCVMIAKNRRDNNIYILLNSV